MSVRKNRNGSFDIEVRTFCPIRNYGLRRQRKNFKGSKAEAIALEKALLAEISNLPKVSSLTTPKKIEPKKEVQILTFGEAADLYLNYCMVRGKTKTYLRAIQYLKKQFGKNEIDNKAFVKTVLDWIEKKRNEVVGNTLNNYLITTKVIVNYAVKLDLLKKSPITTANFPNFPNRKRQRILSSEEERVLLEVIKKHFPRIYPMVKYMSIVPARWLSELYPATIKENYRQEGKIIYVPPENSKARIPIFKPVPPEMLEYFDNLPDTQKYIFFKKRPGYIYAYEMFRKAVSLAGLGKDVCLHTLRHTAITKLVNNGNSHHAIAAICGWTSPNQLQTYYHLSKIEAAQKIKF